MRRTLMLMLVFLAGCGAEQSARTVDPPEAAPPRVASLDWRETYGDSSRRLRFSVDRLTITKGGWSLALSVANDTGIPWKLGGNELTLAFGLMLFPNDDNRELESAARAGRLPPPRAARTFERAPPERLEPNSVWHTVISAPGTLPSGAYVRVVFGTFEAVGKPPRDMQPTVVWITDRTYRL
jgi:hypothetical protein